MSSKAKADSETQQQLPTKPKPFMTGVRGDIKLITTKVQETIKWFNIKTKYGFISQHHMKEDIFVHHPTIQNHKRRKHLFSLGDGKIVQGQKSMQATNITGPRGAAVQASRWMQLKNSGYNEAGIVVQQVKPPPMIKESQRVHVTAAPLLINLPIKLKSYHGRPRVPGAAAEDQAGARGARTDPSPRAVPAHTAPLGHLPHLPPAQKPPAPRAVPEPRPCRTTVPTAASRSPRPSTAAAPGAPRAPARDPGDTATRQKLTDAAPRSGPPARSGCHAPNTRAPRATTAVPAAARGHKEAARPASGAALPAGSPAARCREHVRAHAQAVGPSDT
ncbi:Y-box-binding protein 2-like [Ochotona curzoniae]|uniref:Y-box-binding protein 2-like n=1 Tax=Ochotona curzoniae TaxID=130825 RepID=UPI001B34ED30|nr:Y-box-binding protein 2-like [Ochotona curzoniae]